jgi:hypothetical protein
MTTKCLSVLLGEIYAYLNWIFFNYYIDSR